MSLPKSVWHALGWATAGAVSLHLLRWYHDLEEGEGRRWMFRWLRRWKPGLEAKVQQELNDIEQELIKDRFSDPKVITSSVHLTDHPDEKTVQEVLERLEEPITTMHSGALYTETAPFRETLGRMHQATAWASPTHPEIFPQLRQLEAEVGQICAQLFHGTHESPTVFTAGGTMSILHALHVYREYARTVRGIYHPNIIVPDSIHTSFRKGCHYLRIEYRVTPTHPETGQAQPHLMESLIDANTILLAGSAPSFPYGILDPIQDLGHLADKHGLPFHLDACLGGFQIPFLDHLSEICDFRDPHITSISIDPHKFGKAPKGSSILMFADQKYRPHGVMVDLLWPGGLYVMPGFPGSRPGSSIAETWAVLKLTGRQMYTRCAREAYKLSQKIQRIIKSDFPQLEIFGETEFSTFGFRASQEAPEWFNIFRFGKLLSQKGIYLNGLPEGQHLCLTEKHTLIQDFHLVITRAFREVLEEMEENPEADRGMAETIYCSTQEVTGTRELLPEIGQRYIKVQGMAGRP